jgi:hypothetical protein
MKATNKERAIVPMILALTCLLWSVRSSAQVQDTEINPANPTQAIVNDGVHPGSCKTLTLYTVPKGQRLVIETVHFASTVATEAGPLDNSAAMSTTVGGTTVGYAIKFIGDGTFPPVAGTRSVRIYADPGTKVTANFCQTTPTGPGPTGPGGGGSTISISGYLVPVLP